MSKLGTLVVCSVFMKVVKLKQSHLEELRIYFLNMLFTYGKFEFVKICMAHLLYSYTSFYFYVKIKVNSKFYHRKLYISKV